MSPLPQTSQPNAPDLLGVGRHAAHDAPRVLTYRALGLGDLLTAVPALRAIRAAYPQHRHVLATSSWLAPLVATIEAVDALLPVEELASLPAEAGDADVAVNLHGRGPQSHRVLLAARPRRMLAFHHPGVSTTSGSPRWNEHEHEVVRWCRLLAEHGSAADTSALDLAPPPGPVPDGARGATVVHPGAKSGARRWPVERFAAVARHETANGRHVVVTGSEAERTLAKAVADAAGLPSDSVLAGRLDLAGFARMIASAGRVVCGDTGAAHLATAYRTPSVVLFGPVDPACWGPPPERSDRHRALWAGRTGDPLAEVPDAGLLRIEVNEVTVALDALPLRSEVHRD